jgi:hypothetical protein
MIRHPNPNPNPILTQNIIERQNTSTVPTSIKLNPRSIQPNVNHWLPTHCHQYTVYICLLCTGNSSGITIILLGVCDGDGRTITIWLS